MNIVVFGCDNSGKTTLSLLLDSILGGYVHSPGPLPTAEKQKEFIAKNLDRNKINIFDRFPIIEERVCGIVLRNKNNFDNDLEYVEKTFSQIDLFIYCDPGYSSVTNWGTREQMDGIKDNIQSLIEGYKKVYDYLLEKGYTVIKYNYNENGKFIKYEEIDN